MLLITSTETAENIGVKSVNIANVIKEYFKLEEKGINSDMEAIVEEKVNRK